VGAASHCSPSHSASVQGFCKSPAPVSHPGGNGSGHGRQGRAALRAYAKVLGQYHTLATSEAGVAAKDAALRAHAKVLCQYYTLAACVAARDAALRAHAKILCGYLQGLDNGPIKGNKGKRAPDRAFFNTSATRYDSDQSEPGASKNSTH